MVSQWKLTKFGKCVLRNYSDYGGVKRKRILELGFVRLKRLIKIKTHPNVKRILNVTLI